MAVYDLGGSPYLTSGTFNNSMPGAGRARQGGTVGKQTGPGKSVNAGNPYLSSAPQVGASHQAKPKAAPPPTMSLGGGGGAPPIPPPAPILPPAPVEPPSGIPAMEGLRGAGGGGHEGTAIRTGYQLLRQDLGMRDRPPPAPLTALQKLQIF
jgi:hypothetical protein